MRLIGGSSNRDAIGAIVTVKTSSGLTVRRSVKSGSSYCSQSELPLTFGLGQNDKAASVEIRWPSGRAETYNDMPANLALVVQEAGGVLSGEPIKR